jgi:hypothetical protein
VERLLCPTRLSTFRSRVTSRNVWVGNFARLAFSGPCVTLGPPRGPLRQGQAWVAMGLVGFLGLPGFPLVGIRAGPCVFRRSLRGLGFGGRPPRGDDCCGQSRALLGVLAHRGGRVTAGSPWCPKKPPRSWLFAGARDHWRPWVLPGHLRPLRNCCRVPLFSPSCRESVPKPPVFNGGVCATAGKYSANQIA